MPGVFGDVQGVSLFHFFCRIIDKAIDSHTNTNYTIIRPWDSDHAVNVTETHVAIMRGFQRAECSDLFFSQYINNNLISKLLKLLQTHNIITNRKHKSAVD